MRAGKVGAAASGSDGVPQGFFPFPDGPEGFLPGSVLWGSFCAICPDIPDYCGLLPF